MYDYGDGVPADVSKAIEWYTRASDAGDGNATLNLANIYLLGRNIPVDKHKGIAIIRKAAEQGNPIAASSLGREYTIGDVLPKSIKDATYWIDLAESKGYINCQSVTNLGIMYDEENMYEKAFDYFTKAIEADPNDTNAQYLYAQYEFYGKGTQPNLNDAKNRLEWVVKVDPNDTDAKNLLQIAILKETLQCALNITVPVLKNEYQIWDYNLAVFAHEREIYITLSFCGNNYQNSNYWDAFKNHFSQSKKLSSSEYSVTFESKIPFKSNLEHNLSVAKNILVTLKDVYPYIKISDRGDYLTATWRLE